MSPGSSSVGPNDSVPSTSAAATATTAAAVAWLANRPEAVAHATSSTDSGTVIISSTNNADVSSTTTTFTASSTINPGMSTTTEVNIPTDAAASSASWQDLPLKVLCEVASHLQRPSDLQALLRTSRALNALRLDPHLQVLWCCRWHRSCSLVLLCKHSCREAAQQLLAMFLQGDAMTSGLDLQAMYEAKHPWKGGDKWEYNCYTSALHLAAAANWVEVVRDILVAERHGLVASSAASASQQSSEPVPGQQMTSSAASASLVASLVPGQQVDTSNPGMGPVLGGGTTEDGSSAYVVAVDDFDLFDSVRFDSLAEVLDGSGWTPLQLASKEGLVEVVRELLLGAEWGSGGQQGAAAGGCGDHGGVTKAVKVLNYGSRLHGTALDLAVRNEHVEVVKVLLAVPGIDVNVPSRCLRFLGRTALHWACDLGRSDMVDLLLAAQGVKPGAPDKSGSTPLHLACAGGHLEVVRMLLHAPGVDVNAVKVFEYTGSYSRDRDTEGITPLHSACKHGHVPVVRVLLAVPGIDAGVRDLLGRTPEDVADEEGHKEVVRELRGTRGLGARLDPQHSGCTKDGMPLH